MYRTLMISWNQQLVRSVHVLRPLPLLVAPGRVVDISSVTLAL